MTEGTMEGLRHGIERSPEWRTVEKEHLLIESVCQVCGRNEKLQVHHIAPFHYCIALGRPDLELDHRNLITLCELPNFNHHLLVGHGGNFKISNLDVKVDIKIFKDMDEENIKKSADYQKEDRLKPLDEMTDLDKSAFIEYLDTTYPLIKDIAHAKN